MSFQTYSCLTSNSEASDLLELVWRCAPRLMRTSGGALCREYPPGQPKNVTKCEIKHMESLIGEGLKIIDVAEKLGRSRAIVAVHTRAYRIAHNL